MTSFYFLLSVINYIIAFVFLSKCFIEIKKNINDIDPLKSLYLYLFSIFLIFMGDFALILFLKSYGFKI